MNKHNDIRIYTDLPALEDAVAKHFLLATNQAVQQRGQALIALSGGSTPLGLFHLLGSDAYRATLPWTQIHFFWVDERCVPADAKESNYGQFRHHVPDPLKISQQQIHPMQGNLPAKEAASKYEEMLRGWAEEGQELPRFDWVLLGMGKDGHTASLFPGQMDARVEKHAVIAVKSDYEGRPAKRVTLTPRILNLARQVVFMVSGEGKAARLREVLRGEHNPDRLPAQAIQPVDGRLVWMLDEAAASQL